MGWLCPSCGNENRFSDKTCLACGKKPAPLRLLLERAAAIRERKLWKLPFVEAEERFFSLSDSVCESTGKAQHIFARTVSVTLLLVMMVCASGYIFLNRETALSNFPQVYLLTGAVQKKIMTVGENGELLWEKLRERALMITDEGGTFRRFYEARAAALQQSAPAVFGAMQEKGMNLAGTIPDIGNTLAGRGNTALRNLSYAGSRLMIKEATGQRLSGIIRNLGDQFSRSVGQIAKRIAELREGPP